LRLYDYLATDKPVLSTAIREALELERFMGIGHDVSETVKLLEQMLAGRYPIDLEARRRFIVGQTWEDRAAQLSAVLDGIL